MIDELHKQLLGASADNNGLNSCSTEMGNRSKYSQTVRSNELGYCIGDKTCDKV